MNDTAELFFEYTKQASIIRKRIKQLKGIKKEETTASERVQLNERIKSLREILYDILFAVGCLRRYVPRR